MKKKGGGVVFWKRKLCMLIKMYILCFIILVSYCVYCVQVNSTFISKIKYFNIFKISLSLSFLWYQELILTKIVPFLKAFHKRDHKIPFSKSKSFKKKKKKYYSVKIWNFTNFENFTDKTSSLVWVGRKKNLSKINICIVSIWLSEFDFKYFFTK